MNLLTINLETQLNLMAIESEQLNQTNWQPLNCAACKKTLGHHNNVALIVGSSYIEQPRTNLLCLNCGKVKAYRSPTQNKIVMFLTEIQAHEIIAGEREIKDFYCRNRA